MAMSATCMGLADASRAAAASERVGCSPIEYASLSFSYSDQGFPEVQVNVDGRQVKLLVNTESSGNVIDTATAEALVVRPQLIKQSHVGILGHAVNYRVDLPSLQIGGLTYQDEGFLAVPIQGALGQGVAGWLGINTLLTADFDLELDLAHNRINLLKPHSCPTAPVYWTDHYSAVPLHRTDLGGYFIVMELDGKKLETTLATGLQPTYLQGPGWCRAVQRMLPRLSAAAGDERTEGIAAGPLGAGWADVFHVGGRTGGRQTLGSACSGVASTISPLKPPGTTGYCKG